MQQEQEAEQGGVGRIGPDMAHPDDEASIDEGPQHQAAKIGGRHQADGLHRHLLGKKAHRQQGVEHAVAQNEDHQAGQG
ncbi:hypothetical protein D3C79_891040 [compost metagenome]